MILIALTLFLISIDGFGLSDPLILLTVITYTIFKE